MTDTVSSQNIYLLSWDTLYINKTSKILYYFNIIINHVTGLHISPLIEAGPLTHNIRFRKNPVLMKASKRIKLNL
jgi:hypothetical protein